MTHTTRMEDTTEFIDEELHEAFESETDPGGSYTGTGLYGDLMPEQDADDL